MIYIWPGFSRGRMIRLLAHPPPLFPLPLPVCRPRTHRKPETTRWRKRGGGGAKSYDRKKAWTSINNSILSVLHIPLRRIFISLFLHCSDFSVLFSFFFIIYYYWPPTSQILLITLHCFLGLSLLKSPALHIAGTKKSKHSKGFKSALYLILFREHWEN